MATVNIKKLPDLRFVAGILQQRSQTTEYHDGVPTKITFDWNDVESFETSPDVGRD